MRIGIDVRYLSHALVGGVHTYVRNFVPELLELAGDHRVYLYADRKRPFELASWPSNVEVRLLPWRSALSSVYYDLFLWREMARDRLDVAHFPANVGFGPPGARTIITVHDAINILPLAEILRGHPKTPRTMATMTYLHFATQAAVARADLLLTVSKHAAGEIAAAGRIDPNRIVPIAHAADPSFRRITDPEVLEQTRRRHGLLKPFVLADALKNPGVLTRAWSLLPSDIRDGYEIVFFSRRPDPPAAVIDAKRSGTAKVLVQPSRDDLVALYSLCEAFVFPSWLEGFGLPVLEAMACGAPVIASDRGSLPEVVGSAGLLVDAEDHYALSGLIERLLHTPAEACRLRDMAFVRAGEFSWQRAAQETLNSYERVALGRP